MPDNKTPKYQYDHYDFGDMLDSAVEAGSKLGSSVLGSIADALAQAGDAMSRPQPDSFAAWKRRLERKWKNGGQSVGVALTAVGWTFTGCFGIAALVLGILTAVGAGPLGLSQQDFIALPILTAVFYPATLGFLFMAIVGMKKLAYFGRLRKLLRAANDWTCDLPALARKAQIKQEKAYETVAKAVANGDLPNAAISDDYSTLYLDDSLMPTAAKPAAAPQAEPAEPLTDAEQFRREGMDFFELLKSLPRQAGHRCGRRACRNAENLRVDHGLCPQPPGAAEPRAPLPRVLPANDPQAAGHGAGPGRYGQRERGGDPPRHHRHPAHAEPSV